MWFFEKERQQRELLNSIAIRLEAIGGQGANSAGKILAEAGVLGMHFTGNHFSSFGSEKRGTPVRSFVRLRRDRTPVRSASFIREPNVLVLFHESLLWTHPEILEGVNRETMIILNTARRPSDVAFPAEIEMSEVHILNATQLATRTKCGLNAVMLGAISQILPEVQQMVLQDTLARYFADKGSEVVACNQEGFNLGVKNLKSFSVKHNLSSADALTKFQPSMGWENAPVGGVITNPGNSALKDHSVSRKGFAPLFVQDICFNCGYCDMVCPDYCFVWKSDESGKPKLEGIDYQYCKACQKCVQVCPVGALVVTPENEIPAESKKVNWLKQRGNWNPNEE